MKQFERGGFHLGNAQINADDFRDCVSPTLVIEKPGYEAAHLGNYQSLQMFVVGCLLNYLGILIIEKTSFYWTTSLRRRKMTQWHARHIKVY